MTAHGTKDVPTSFQVSGTGICSSMLIDFGDHFPPSEFKNVDLSKGPVFNHTYVGWGGIKRITVSGQGDCVGVADKLFRIVPIISRMGLVPEKTKVCGATGFPVLRKNTIVRFSNLNAGSPTEPLIDFGCPGGCRHNADGTGLIAGPPYPFVGLIERSLVFRVGSQRAQGGTQGEFVTTDRGELEFCVNEATPGNNKGGWGIGIEINAANAN